MTSIDTNELKRSSGAELDVNQEKKLSRCARDVVRVTLLGESLRERTRIPFDDTNPDHLAVLKSVSTMIRQLFQFHTHVDVALGSSSRGTL